MNTAKSAKSKKIEKVTVIEKDAVDDLMFEVVRESSKFNSLVECDLESNSEGLVQDAFTSFFAHEPQTVEQAEPVQKGIIDTMMALPEFDNLRASAAYDEVGSALGAIQFAPELIKQYKELKKKFEEKKKENESQGKPGPEKLEDGVDSKDMAGLRQGMRRALEKAKDDADDYQDMVANWGIDSAELSKVPFEKRFELAERMGKTDRLKKVSDLVGRFRNIVHTAAATTPVHGVDEIVDIGLSSDVSRMLPTEVVKLVETPDLFISDFLEGKLMTYNLKGKQDIGKGPIIAMLDNSGSMSGERIEWAVATALSLALLAEKQNRAFGLIVFNSRVVFKKYWPKGLPISLNDKVSIAEIGCDGGTSFHEPLKAAFNFRMEEPSLKPADFVFITDGDCDIYGEQLEEILVMKKKAEVRIYSIVINDGHYGGQTGGTLEKFSDQYVTINSLGEMDTIKNLMTATASTQSASQKAHVKAHQDDSVNLDDDGEDAPF